MFKILGKFWLKLVVLFATILSFNCTYSLSQEQIENLRRVQSVILNAGDNVVEVTNSLKQNYPWLDDNILEYIRQCDSDLPDVFDQLENNMEPIDIPSDPIDLSEFQAELMHNTDERLSISQEESESNSDEANDSEGDESDDDQWARLGIKEQDQEQYQILPALRKPEINYYYFSLQEEYNPMAV